MPACKSCGMWYAKVRREELCPLCEQALGRLAGYAAPVVRCKDCKYHYRKQEPCHGRTEHFCTLLNGLVGVTRDSFCSYGERGDKGERDG